MILPLLVTLLVTIPPPDTPRSEHEITRRESLPGDSLAAAAQKDPARTTSPWAAQLVYNRQQLSENRSPWTTVRLLLKREHARGSLIIDGSRTARFGTADATTAVSVWPELGPGRYGHLRLEYAPEPDVLPQLAIGARLYQSFGAWEISGGYEQRRVEGPPVRRITAAVARYVGSWYVRTQTAIIPRSSERGFVQRLGVRYFLEGPSDYVDLAAGGGRVVTIVARGPVVRLTPTYFVTGRLQRFLTTHVGFSLLASYADDAYYARRGVLLGVLTRW